MNSAELVEIKLCNIKHTTIEEIENTTSKCAHNGCCKMIEIERVELIKHSSFLSFRLDNLESTEKCFKKSKS